MRFVRLTRVRGEAEMKASEGKYPTMPCRLLSGNFVAGIDPAQAPLLACCRHVFTGQETKEIRELLNPAATLTPHRGPAAGPIDKLWKGYCLVNHYAMNTIAGKPNHVNKKVHSGVVGYNSGSSGLSAWSQRNPAAMAKLLFYLKKLAERYKQVLPIAHERQSQLKIKRLKGTPFRSLFVNRNFRTALHRDNNTSTSAMGVLFVVGSHVSGGILQFPEVAVMVDVQPGDVLFFHPELWHSNTALAKDVDRLSIVCHG